MDQSIKLNRNDPKYHAIIGRMGGLTNRKKGREYFSKIGKKGGDVIKRSRPRGYFKQLSKRRKVVIAKRDRERAEHLLQQESQHPVSLVE